MIVDLPAPFSPTTAWISPGEIPNDTSFTAVMPPKRLVTCSSRITSIVAGGSLMTTLASYRVPPGRASRWDLQLCATAPGLLEAFLDVADRHRAGPRPGDPRSARPSTRGNSRTELDRQFAARHSRRHSQLSRSPSASR